jgi:N-methylhydantoinase A
VSALATTVVVGVDVGGTFTDLVLLDEATGAVRTAKVPSTPRNQAEGVLASLAGASVKAGEIKVLVHGTTAATNALIERKGARTGLITTRGFRDVLELGRRTRPTPYGLKGSFEPLIPRDLRLEVTERLDAEGEVVLALDEEEVRRAARALRERGVEALVIHFIHSYANDRHERRARELVAAEWPNDYITAGAELLPEYREYERGTTASINGFVQPVIDRYLRTLADELRRRGCRREPLVMQGNGGTMSIDVAGRHAVNTLMSGPAAGVKAAAYTALAAGFPNVISCDMGGTSFDVGLIRDGRPVVSADKELGYGLPVRVPMIDIHTIGAGGGSIATVNGAGILQVGPESAGADPGPICYARGGEAPTITDANLLLGRLNPDALLGVEQRVDLASIRDAMDRRLGAPLGLDPVQVASAIVRVANDKMAGAIRLVSLNRGHDPRDFVLLAFGGAGPLHASALARELAIPRVLVPARPGLTSALGCLVADVRHDFVKTVNQDLRHMDVPGARRILAAHVAEGQRLLATEGVEIETVTVLHEADMQFVGQTHVLTVEVPRTDFERNDLLQAFERAYWERFEVALSEMRCLLVSLRTTVVGRRRAVSLEGLAGIPAAGSLRDAQAGSRPVWFDGEWRPTPIYRRERLPRGAEFTGPAIVEQFDTTTVVEPGDHATVDPLGNLVITVRTGNAAGIHDPGPGRTT